jgi:glutamate-1-semialdehyde 2,1-aminomutase
MTNSPQDPARNFDREFFRRELDSFVPLRVFDAHAHLYRAAFLAGEPPPLMKQFPEFGMAAFRALTEELTPGRRTSGLFFGFPHAAMDTDANNRFLAEEIRVDPQSRGQMLVTPAMDPEYVREIVRRYQFVGLKCYHVFATTRPTFDAAIPAYLPEAHVRVAHEEGLSITLHMVRARAMADPVNQEVIRDFACRYPNARFILAHAARGFNPFHTIEGIGALRGLRNVWCDSSAVTDGGAYEAIIRTLGVDRLMYGSDAPVSHLRGRCVAIGDSFLWLNESNTRFAADYAEIRPALVGHESLRTLRTACWNLNLPDSDVEKIFFGNAAELYGIGN